MSKLSGQAWHDLTALDLAAAVRQGEISAVEVAELTVERARALGPAVGAFVHLSEELALAQARAADEALAAARSQGRADADLPPLLGVPVPIKDLTQVAGEPFEAGSRALRGNIAQVDDGVVQLLAEAGTVMVGKTTTPEFGMPSYTEPDIAPPARTPFDLRRSAGGSSGGAAAAVAARIVPAAQGSDGGGSIRIPAACCGLVGHKPSRDLIRSGPHGTPGFGLATDGVLTRSVADTAALLDVLSRPWPGGPALAARPAEGFLGALRHQPRSLRIGVLRDPVVVDDADVHLEAHRAVDRAAGVLADLGHELVPAPHPFTQKDWEIFSPIWATGALSIPLAPEDEAQLVPLTRWLRAQGRAVTAVELAAAVRGMQRLQWQVGERWQDLDVVLSPTLAQPPAMIGEHRNDADPAADFLAQSRYTPWTSLWNILGAPAISLPLHRALIEGVELPFGIMLGAAHGRDADLLALAAQVEMADPWPLPPEVAPVP